MKRLLISCTFVALWSAATAGNASAETIFESGTLGPTGVPRSEVTGGSNVSPVVFVGVRFYLDQPVLTTQVGGHFVNNIGADQSFFGAIVALEDGNDFPDSGDFSTADFIGSTVLDFPEPSDEVFGDLVERLDPGWYALVFGSGLFGGTGSGVALNNGVDNGMPGYIAWQPGAVNGWGNLINPIFRNFRFVIQGNSVPEPATATLAPIAVLLLLVIRSRNRH